jgi:hypothetical protein
VEVGVCIFALLGAPACGGSGDRSAAGSGGVATSAGSGNTAGSSNAGGGASGGTSSSSGGVTSHGGTTPSSGGVTSHGGATPSSGGVAGASGAANGAESKYSACVKYFDAECNRMEECRTGLPPTDSPCPSSTDQCPDALFSDGSTRTIDDLIACAATWKTYPCSEVNQQHRPDCVHFGTRAPGEPCLYLNQCSSGICNSAMHPPGHPDCSVCVAKAAPGEACSQATGPGCGDGYTCSCPPGSDCGGKTICVVATPIGKPLGASCMLAGECYSGTTCVPDANDPTQKTCQKAPTVGEACAAPDACSGASFCNSAKTCEAFPGVGNPCTLGPTGNVLEPGCAAGAMCSNGQCISEPAQGEHCHATPGTFVDYVCASGLFCACDDDACATGTCIQRRNQGQSCGAINTRCVPGTSCQNGSCVALDSQGTFAKACLN